MKMGTFLNAYQKNVPFTCSFHGSIRLCDILCAKLTYCPKGGVSRRLMARPKWYKGTCLVNKCSQLTDTALPLFAPPRVIHDRKVRGH